jgi:hypothetical protein
VRLPTGNFCERCATGVGSPQAARGARRSNQRIWWTVALVFLIGLIIGLIVLRALLR